MKSRVKWFNNERGFGFLEYNNVEDIFVHYSAINMKGYKTLAEGENVEFELIRTNKGLQAKNVVSLSSVVPTNDEIFYSY